MEPVFTAFATAAFFEFALFAVFEMRYLLHAWRARRDPAQDVWAQQRELSVLYARFYGALLGGVFLSFQLRRWVYYSCITFGKPWKIFMLGTPRIAVPRVL